MKYPRTWTSRPRSTAVISMPETRRTPCRAAATAASARPAVVSWSVTLMIVRPRPAARATSASGDRRPSDAVVWRCRSITASGRGVKARLGLLLRAALTLTLDQGAVLADQQVEMLPFLIGELEEDFL